MEHEYWIQDLGKNTETSHNLIKPINKLFVLFVKSLILTLNQEAELDSIKVRLRFDFQTENSNYFMNKRKSFYSLWIFYICYSMPCHTLYSMAIQEIAF